MSKPSISRMRWWHRAHGLPGHGHQLRRSRQPGGGPAVRAEGARARRGGDGRHPGRRSSGPMPRSSCPPAGSSTGWARASPTRSRSSGGRCSRRLTPPPAASRRCSAFRLLLGAGEAPAYPSTRKSSREWFPKRERAFATSIFDSGARVGTALSLPIVTTLVAVLGWRASFVVTGAARLLLGVALAAALPPPREHPRVSRRRSWPTSRRTARAPRPTAAAEAPHRKPPCAGATCSATGRCWGMMLGFFCLNFVIYFFITWFPTYLIKARGFTPAQARVSRDHPRAGRDPLRLARRAASPTPGAPRLRLTWARKIPIVGGMLMSSSIALAVLVPERRLGAGAAVALATPASTFAAASVWSLPADVAPTPRHVASIGGIQNFASNLAGIRISTSSASCSARRAASSCRCWWPAAFASGRASYLVIVGESRRWGAMPAFPPLDGPLAGDQAGTGAKRR